MTIEWNGDEATLTTATVTLVILYSRSGNLPYKCFSFDGIRARTKVASA